MGFPPTMSKYFQQWYNWWEEWISVYIRGAGRHNRKVDRQIDKSFIYGTCEDENYGRTVYYKSDKNTAEPRYELENVPKT